MPVTSKWIGTLSMVLLLLIAAMPAGSKSKAVPFGPKIEVDTMDVDVGTVIEGQSASIKHVFKIKNGGDSVLAILNVKPG